MMVVVVVKDSIPLPPPPSYRTDVAVAGRGEKGKEAIKRGR
jgi:hypothetical protein